MHYEKPLENPPDPPRGRRPRARRSRRAYGAGVILTELGDGRDFHNEVVEIFFDAGEGR